jgi:hypothetical protein
MSELSENTLEDQKLINVDSADNLVINTDKTDNVPTEPVAKKKQIRKPLSEEQKEKKTEILAKARQVRTDKSKTNIINETEFKERVKTISNLDDIITRKVKESIPVKEPKLKPTKEEKEAKRLELIDKIVSEKLSQYKPPKLSDLELIKRLF